MPTSRLDLKGLIFYAGTADGDDQVKTVKFLAYDVQHGRVLYTDDHGPCRYLIFARSTGRVYFHGNPEDAGQQPDKEPCRLVRFDLETPGKPTPINAHVGLRAATDETADGIVYTVDGDHVWAFDIHAERTTSFGRIGVGNETYIASIDVDPATGRYLYFVAGAHSGSYQDGAPLVQFDVKQRSSKVIAFLNPALYRRFGHIPLGTYGTAVSPQGDKVYIIWQGVSRCRFG